MSHHNNKQKNNFETRYEPESILVRRIRDIIPAAVENLRPHAGFEDTAEQAVPPQQEAAKVFNAQVTTNLQPSADSLMAGSEARANITDLRTDVARQAVAAAQGETNPLLEEYLQNVEEAA